MNNYETLEDDIVDRLSALQVEGIDIEPFPDVPADFEKPFERPRISVMYKSSEFSGTVVRGLPDTVSTGPAIQDEFADVEIVFRSRKKRGEVGIYEMIRKTRLLLIGFAPTHFGKIYLKDTAFVKHDTEEGLWVYSMSVTCQGKAIQAFDDDDTAGLPTLNQANFVFNG